MKPKRARCRASGRASQRAERRGRRQGGGDHSELGAVDAEAFCLEQGLSAYDARLVAWLVRNHLALSITSQKQDITDPEVVNEFARRVGDPTHLDYLYVLTCADVRGTNPKLTGNTVSVTVPQGPATAHAVVTMRRRGIF